MFVLGHFLLLEAHSSSRALVLEIVLFSQHVIFSCQRKIIVYSFPRDYQF